MFASQSSILIPTKKGFSFFLWCFDHIGCVSLSFFLSTRAATFVNIGRRRRRSLVKGTIPLLLLQLLLLLRLILRCWWRDCFHLDQRLDVLCEQRVEACIISHIRVVVIAVHLIRKQHFYCKKSWYITYNQHTGQCWCNNESWICNTSNIFENKRELYLKDWPQKFNIRISFIFCIWFFT